MENIGIADVLFVIFLMAPMNSLLTTLFVEGKLFEDVREWIDSFGKWLQGHGRKRVGPKLVYFVGCFLCVGVWVGFLQGVFFEGPLHLSSRFSRYDFMANGLLYKAWGHLFLQLGKLLHHCIEVLIARTSLHEEEAKAVLGQGPQDYSVGLPKAAPSNGNSVVAGMRT